MQRMEEKKMDEHYSHLVWCAASQLPVLLANEDTNQQQQRALLCLFFFQVLPLISLSLFVSKVLYQSITFWCVQICLYLVHTKCLMKILAKINVCFMYSPYRSFRPSSGKWWPWNMLWEFEGRYPAHWLQAFLASSYLNSRHCQSIMPPFSF
jgi:hypothetical protein